jgi:hypothetical protein
VRALRRSPAKHIDLLPQDQVFRFQRCSRLEARSQDTENQPEQIGHQDASLRRPLAESTPNRIFGTHRQAAMEALLLVVEQTGPTMFARIGVMQALNRSVERVFDSSRKERHWEKRKLARDR